MFIGAWMVFGGYWRSLVSSRCTQWVLWVFIGAWVLFGGYLRCFVYGVEVQGTW